MIFHVSMLLVPEVDAGVLVGLMSAPMVLELSAKAICPTCFSRFFMLRP